MRKTLIRAAALHKVVPLSRTTIWRLERAGLFPKRRRISKNSVAWVEEEVLEWILSKIK